MLGDRFSAVDIYLFTLTKCLSDDHGHPVVREFANVNRIGQAVKLGPSVQMVYGPV